MGRKLQRIKLFVFLQKTLVGEYLKNPDGSTVFTYDPSWVREGFAISHSLPLTTTPYKGDIVEAYFDNLLPDQKELREVIASRVKANSSGIFDLLMAIGQDCVGGLRFVRTKEFASSTSPRGRPLSKREI